MKSVSLIVFFCAVTFMVTAQSLPVEMMTGHNRTGIDVLWFRKFNPDKNKYSPWLFFYRSRGSSDYHNKTSFGVTNAISYNFKSSIGLVLATQFLQNGFVAKTGVQYAKMFKNGSFFSWLVAGNNTSNNFSADWFILTRWTPKLNEIWKWFTQVEFLSSLDEEQIKNLTQRFRFGIGRDRWQFGLAADFNETGNKTLITINNIGTFLRREF